MFSIRGRGDQVLKGQQIYDLVVKLWPICRSLTGNGVRETLSLINEVLPLTIHEVPTGTEAFGWEVPEEWNIRSAFVEDEAGNRIVDMKDSNLHVVGYSIPIDAWVDLEELQKHLYSDEKMPNAIPYITAYYDRKWGFCIEHNKRQSLKPGKYHVVVDSELKNGSLTYGECVLRGQSEKEVLLATYVCHPSMANNELSGPSLLAHLGKWISEIDKKYTYRIIFIPETIGAFVYLKHNYEYMKDKTIAAINISCVGDNRCYSFISSRYGNTLSDKIAKHILYHTDKDYKSYSFLARGSNERIFCAPGFELPMINMSRSLFHRYPEYHTSMDNLDLVSPDGFQNSFDLYTRFINAVEKNECYMLATPGEPRLGKYGLYGTINNARGLTPFTRAAIDFTAYADGTNNLVDIANIINVPIWHLYDVVDILLEKGIIKKYEVNNRDSSVRPQLWCSHNL